MQPFSIDYITGTAEPRTSYDMGTTTRVLVDQNDSIFSTPTFDDVYNVINQDVSLSQITPTFTYVDVKSTGNRDLSTPSPTRDSGIDSDSSPVGQTIDTVSMTIRDLEKKAARSVQSVGPKSTEKPPHSYIALIARAILSVPDRKLTLCDIYRHIMENHGYYDNDEKAWRNSIRYNLSVNECFMKNGKEETGKGHYWAIHPTCEENFENGDYRRRHARRRARRNMKTLSSADTSAATQSRAAVYTPMTPTNLTYQPYNLPTFPAQPQSAYSISNVGSSHQLAPSSLAPMNYGLPMGSASKSQASAYPTGLHPYGQYQSFYTTPSLFAQHQGQQLYHQQLLRQQQQQQQQRTDVTSEGKPAGIMDSVMKAWSTVEAAPTGNNIESQVVIIA